MQFVRNSLMVQKWSNHDRSMHYISSYVHILYIVCLRCILWIMAFYPFFIFIKCLFSFIVKYFELHFLYERCYTHTVCLLVLLWLLLTNLAFGCCSVICICSPQLISLSFSNLLMVWPGVSPLQRGWGIALPLLLMSRLPHGWLAVTTALLLMVLMVCRSDLCTLRVCRQMDLDAFCFSQIINKSTLDISNFGFKKKKTVIIDNGIMWCLSTCSECNS